MSIHTFQISQQRRLRDRGVTLVDTTVKSGYHQVAPRWDMVMNHKKGIITDEEYTRDYLQILDYYWFHDPDFFAELLTIEKIGLGCYCPPGKFCHRHLLASFLSHVSHHTIEGELTP